MANHEQPYDPYIPSGQGISGSSAQHAAQDNRTAALQAQIDDTVNVMRQNIQRTEQRGDELNRMQNQTVGLADSARNFNRGTNRMMKRMQMKNIRMWIYIGIIVAIFVAIIVLAVHFGKK
ncbi:MAG: hypothetical protein Q9212_003850 [Teloschistes hypoglaucus]